MGYLRVLLALMVVFSHRGALQEGAGWVLQGGAIFAVKAFFMVSGFYMSLVIHDRYHRLPVGNFYTSRLLRLIPVYWMIGLITFAAEFFLIPNGQRFYSQVSPVFYWTGPNGLDFSGIPVALWVYIAVSVITLLGADTWLWLGFSRKDGTLSLAPSYGPNATSANALSPVPQAWSIGCELWFYLIAPFVVRRLWLVVVLIAASLACRFYLLAYGFSGEPWNRSFFPSELIYFLFGVFAHHLYTRFPNYRFPTGYERHCLVATLLVTWMMGPLSVLVLRRLGDIEAWNLLPYPLLLAVLPCLFRASKDDARDNLVGELSYPLYMVHNLVYGLVAALPFNIQAAIGTGWIWAFFNLLCVVLAAILLDRYIARPIDRLRRRFGARGPAAIPTEPQLTTKKQPT